MVPEFRRSNKIEKNVIVPVMTAYAYRNCLCGKTDDYTYFCAYIYTVLFSVYIKINFIYLDLQIL